MYNSRKFRRFYRNVLMAMNCLLLLLTGCNHNISETENITKFEGTWKKDYYELIFSKNLWVYWIPETPPPVFNGDENYAFPDDCASYEDHDLNEIDNFFSSNGNLEYTHNIITLEDKYKEHIFSYEIINNRLKLKESNAGIYTFFDGEWKKIN